MQSSGLLGSSPSTPQMGVGSRSGSDHPETFGMARQRDGDPTTFGSFNPFHPKYHCPIPIFNNLALSEATIQAA
jgi:hypothetical protein